MFVSLLELKTSFFFRKKITEKNNPTIGVDAGKTQVNELFIIVGATARISGASRVRALIFRRNAIAFRTIGIG